MSTRHPLFAATLATAVLAAPNAHAAIFTVINANASGAGSLAQAISDANATIGSDTIAFAVSGKFVHVIPGPLPAITQPLLIDGFTQGGSTANTNPSGAINAKLQIGISGDAVTSPGSAVLDIASKGVIVQGIEFSGIRSGVVGIRIGKGSSDVEVRGCYIGTSSQGTVDSSSGDGIEVQGDASIGGEDPFQRCVISGNNGSGIVLESGNVTVEGNLIGAAANALSSLGNGVGVLVSPFNERDAAATQNKFIGGAGDSAGNLIATNGKGIVLTANAGSGVTILHNTYSGNGGRGIDLGDDGLTPNDPDDVDTGPNNLQNFPVFTFVRDDGSVRHFEGYLNSTAGPADYRVELYAQKYHGGPDTDQGTVYLGFVPVSILAGQTVGWFQADSSASLSELAGEILYLATATPTGSDFSTSEFSVAVPADSLNAEFTVTNTEDSGPGSLRAAIDQANLNDDENTIVFAIPGEGVHTIKLTNTLSAVHPVIIDGYSQHGAHPNSLARGSNADLRIEIDGSTLPAFADALVIEHTTATIRGLAIGHARRDAINSSVSTVQVYGCFLGTDASGNVAAPNGRDGVHLSESNSSRIGGSDRVQTNVISASFNHGIELVSSIDVAIQGNVLGGNSSGDSNLGNEEFGIYADDSAATIGSDSPGAIAIGVAGVTPAPSDGSPNIIRGNGSGGIGADGTTTILHIAGNEIVDNDGLGIDLLDPIFTPGVTPNDPGDADDGPDGLQNFPILTDVNIFSGGIRVAGVLDIPAQFGVQGFELRLFANQSCDDSMHGEGETFLGETDITLSADQKLFSVVLQGELPHGTPITATVTSASGTSEFSSCAALRICGDANDDGKVVTSDALTVLRVAVGSAQCALCICDINDNGKVTSSDALLVLRHAVGQNVEILCGTCR